MIASIVSFFLSKAIYIIFLSVNKYLTVSGSVKICCFIFDHEIIITRSFFASQVLEFLDDSVPEVRAAAVYSLGCLVRNRSENNEHATTVFVYCVKIRHTAASGPLCTRVCTYIYLNVCVCACPQALRP